MRNLFLWLLCLVLLSGCSRLDAIPYSPQQTPETWLNSQPYVEIKLGSAEITLVQPSSTVLVYLLGIVAIGAGLLFFRVRKDHQSRKWWGVALVLWGLGALFAGTSYQAFSYEIKCAGRTVCSWTSWWEVIYLMLSAASVDAMMLAEAYACAVGRWRKVMSTIAWVKIAVYVIVVLIGALVPIRFLISFELLLLVSAPNILIFAVLNGWRYAKLKTGMDLALLGTWIGLGLVIGGYYGYLVLDITHQLWARGIWFSENDVLHIGLMIWMLTIALGVSKRVVDEPHP